VRSYVKSVAIRTASIATLTVLLVVGACAPTPRALPGPKRPLWFGLHVMVESKADARGLLSAIPSLASSGVNLLIAEIDYNYEYVSHPELRGDDPVSRDTIKQIVAPCREHHIRLIPEFQSLGHQSWEKKTFPLLVKYPQFDETPGKYPDNQGIYCRSWCPLHPDLPAIIFDLYDELIDVCEADALHVGVDEVFIIADPDCPRCHGKDPAELFAKAVNDAYDHIVRKRGKEMWMWGDRFIDGRAMGYGEWEASENGTYPAVDLVPKDIVICDWHYERAYRKMARYGFPSVPMFMAKGFRVVPTSFRDTKAVDNLLLYSLAYQSDRMLGYLCTIWHSLPPGMPVDLPALKVAAARLRPIMLPPR
jgi:hypothetical protein